jgi:glutamyl-tRNA reductase
MVVPWQSAIPAWSYFWSDNMSDFNRKVEEASVRMNRSVTEATDRLEEESAEFIKYLNDEVVPAIRQHSTKALRTAAEKLARLADYMDQNRHQH